MKKNGVNAALTAAPGYHTVTIDLASSAGFAAAQMISSLSASTPSGKRATLSLAAAGLFSTQSEAEQFGKAAPLRPVRLAELRRLYRDVPVGRNVGGGL